MDDFEKLKSIDIEEIYQKTYIAKKNIKAILNRDFSKFDRLKALGFINIIEREFNLDLSDLKKEVNDFFSKDKEEIEELKEENRIKRDKKILFIPLIISILILIFFIFNSSKKSINNKNNISNIVLKEKNESKKEANQTAEKNITLIKKEENLKLEDKNETIKEIKEKEVILNPKISIIPKQKVWIGIIYLDNYSKKNFITSDIIDLNGSKDQLIVTGHGYIKIKIDSNITDYNKKEKLRFIYKDGKFQLIDKNMFKKYNRGKNW